MRLAVLFSLLPAILATPISQLAPLSSNGNIIDDQYIVVFKKGVDPANIALHLDSIAESTLASVSVCLPLPRRHHPISVTSGHTHHCPIATPASPTNSLAALDACPHRWRRWCARASAGSVAGRVATRWQQTRALVLTRRSPFRARRPVLPTSSPPKVSTMLVTVSR